MTNMPICPICGNKISGLFYTSDYQKEGTFSHGAMNCYQCEKKFVHYNLDLYGQSGLSNKILCDSIFNAWNYLVKGENTGRSYPPMCPKCKNVMNVYNWTTFTKEKVAEISCPNCDKKDKEYYKMQLFSRMDVSQEQMRFAVVEAWCTVYHHAEFETYWKIDPANITWDEPGYFLDQTVWSGIYKKKNPCGEIITGYRFPPIRIPPGTTA